MYEDPIPDVGNTAPRMLDVRNGADVGSSVSGHGTLGARRWGGDGRDVKRLYCLSVGKIGDGDDGSQTPPSLLGFLIVPRRSCVINLFTGPTKDTSRDEDDKE